MTDSRVASIAYEDEWIDAAGEELESCSNEPFLGPFLELWGADPDEYDSPGEKVEAIKTWVRAPDHPLRLDDLAEYLVELKNFG